MERECYIDSTFGAIETMARIRQNINMEKTGKITQERALSRIEELLDKYEQCELLWAENELGFDMSAGKRS